MYALKARDKLHKREKVEYKERKRGDQGRAREVDAYHRGETSHDSRVADRRQPATTKREAKYIGSFSIEMKPCWKSDIGKAVKHHLSKVKPKDSGSCQLPVCILVNMEGVKVLSADGRELIMAHALRRILHCAVDGKKHLFAMVSRNPDTGVEGIYSHVFATAKKDQANELNELMGKAFKAGYAKKSLKRNKKKGRLSDTPWRVVLTDPSTTQPTSSQSQESSEPTPTAPPPIPLHSYQQAPPISPHSYQPTSPISPPAYSREQLLYEASQLEGDIARLSSRMREIEDQMREVASIEEAVMQLTVQMSTHQQQLDEKQRQLLVLQQQLQNVSMATGSTQLPPPYSALAPVSPQFNVNPLPDFASISLEDAEWFQEGIPREIAMEILSYQPEGGFIVRQSSSSPGCYALSLKAPQGRIVHFLIENVTSGVQLQGSHLTFPTLVDLIHHLTVNKESLPCTLNLDTSNPTFRDRTASSAQDSDSDNDDIDFATPAQYHMMT